MAAILVLLLASLCAAVHLPRGGLQPKTLPVLSGEAVGCLHIPSPTMMATVSLAPRHTSPSPAWTCFPHEHAPLSFEQRACDDVMDFSLEEAEARLAEKTTIRFAEEEEAGDDTRVGSASARSVLQDDSDSFGSSSSSSSSSSVSRLVARDCSRDWVHCLATWPRSFVLRRIRSPLVALTVWSAFVALASARLSAPLAPVGTSVHTLVGGALSLLLVFRTNTAYARFWEGRQIFDQLSSTTRDLADFVGLYREECGEARCKSVLALLSAFPMALQLHLQGFTFECDDEFGESGAGACSTSSATGQQQHVGERELLDIFARLGGAADGRGEIALPAFLKALSEQDDVACALGLPTDLDLDFALGQLHLLKFGGRARGEGAGVTLSELACYYAPLQLWRALADSGCASRDKIARSSNLPLAIATLLAREAKAVPYVMHEMAFTSRERLWVLSQIAKLRAAISAAERIVHTPVPLHYVRHTSRFLSVWCFTLPLCLANKIHPLLLPPVVAVVAWSLIGLREIGILIENPFRRSLQLTAVTDTLRREIAEVTQLHLDDDDACADLKQPHDRDADFCAFLNDGRNENFATAAR